MARRTLIAPSILSADFGRLAEEIRDISEAGADYIHVDVMDGHFVPNLTLGPPIIKYVKAATKVPLDVHLMITNAEATLEMYAEAGADLICVHAEACTHLHRAVHAIKKLGRKAAVSLNPATPVSALDWVLDDLDMVLIMSVNPGFGGQKFIPQALQKIAALRAEADRRGLHALDIEVDGGIKVDNVEAVARAGANVIVSGSGIFSERDYRATISALRHRADLAAGRAA